MMNRKLMATTYVVLVLAALVMSYAGVLSGLQRAWFGSAWFFTISVVIFVSITSVGLQQKIEGCFQRLANVTSRETGPIKLESLFKISPAAILVGISGVVMFSLSIFAAFRERWLIVCILLAGTLVTNVLSSALYLGWRIQTYSRFLEELISQNKESAAHMEPSGPEMH